MSNLESVACTSASRNGTVGGLRDLADTNGLGQVACGATLASCTTIGAAIKP
jgi:hypothetical protein